jgi:uncharacterized membrane protein YhaH (DUF805 family)
MSRERAGTEGVIMEWMLLPLKRYADFSGRSRRKEYWMFTLGVVIVEVLLVALFFMLAGPSFGDAGPAGNISAAAWLPLGILVLFGLAIFIPSLAVAVRRFHDQDKSGWFILLSFIPYLGGLILIIFMCIDGTRGPNRFGPDPKDPDSAEVFA